MPSPITLMYSFHFYLKLKNIRNVPTHTESWDLYAFSHLKCMYLISCIKNYFCLVQLRHTMHNQVRFYIYNRLVWVCRSYARVISFLCWLVINYLKWIFNIQCHFGIFFLRNLYRRCKQFAEIRNFFYVKRSIYMAAKSFHISKLTQIV